jgi:hypothetical protein
MYSLQRLGAGRRDMHSIHPAFERGGGSWPAFSCFLLFTLIALFICGRTRGQTALMGRHLWIALDKRFFSLGWGMCGGRSEMHRYMGQWWRRKSPTDVYYYDDCTVAKSRHDVRED